MLYWSWFDVWINRLYKNLRHTHSTRDGRIWNQNNFQSYRTVRLGALAKFAILHSKIGRRVDFARVRYDTMQSKSTRGHGPGDRGHQSRPRPKCTAGPPRMDHLRAYIGFSHIKSSRPSFLPCYYLHRVLPAGLARMEIVIFMTVRFENHAISVLNCNTNTQVASTGNLPPPFLTLVYNPYRRWIFFEVSIWELVIFWTKFRFSNIWSLVSKSFICLVLGSIVTMNR
jgi:hypothetical protein